MLGWVGEVFDIIGELWSATPWIYRVWGWIFIKNYRIECFREYSHQSALSKYFDIFMSVAFFITESIIIFYIVRAIF